MDIDGDDLRYRVVVNHEEQYPIWSAARDNPPGWLDAGTDVIEGVRPSAWRGLSDWSDMRPLSLRRSLDVVHPS